MFVVLKMESLTAAPGHAHTHTVAVVEMIVCYRTDLQQSLHQLIYFLKKLNIKNKLLQSVLSLISRMNDIFALTQY